MYGSCQLEGRGLYVAVPKGTKIVQWRESNIPMTRRPVVLDSEDQKSVCDPIGWNLDLMEGEIPGGVH